MRRAEKQVTDPTAIREILRKCMICDVAVNDNGVPYVLPVNYGFEMDGDNRLTLYFHGAAAGRKYGLWRDGAQAAFSLYLDNGLDGGEGTESCSYGVFYQSVLGTGRIELLEDTADRIAGLNALMRQVTGNDDTRNYSAAALSKTAVYRLIVTEYTAKEDKKS